MKRTLLLLSFLLTVHFLPAQLNHVNQSIYDVLASANKEWLRQQPDEILLQRNTIFSTDDVLIQFHLNQVETRLREANITHLSTAQKMNRGLCLNHLHEYWLTGRFPNNTHHTTRTPYFIDDCGTVCAVGYLLVKTGHQDFANRISEENNYFYVRQMNYPELLAWAAEYGFSTDELALIQMPYMPSYPTFEWTSVEGIDIVGAVTTVKVDVDRNVLYVSADFESFGNGIASYDGVDWNYLGDVDGTIDVIVIDNQNVIVGGSFTAVGGIAANNVAVWNGNQWNALGNGLNGEVKTYAFHNDDLFAGGSFIFSSSQSAIAKYDGTSWLPVPNGPNGIVYALKEYGNGDLYIGGEFSNVGSLQVKNFVKFDGNIFYDIGSYPSSIYTMEVLRDTLFIAGQFMTDTINSTRFGFAAYYNSNLISLSGASMSSGVDDSIFINSISVAGGKLFITGKSLYNFIDGTYAYYSGQLMYDFGGYMVAPMAVATGIIHSATEYNGANLIGGNFNRIINAGTFNEFTDVSKFASTGKIATSISPVESNPNVLIIYEPSKVIIKIGDTISDDELLLNSIDGRQVLLTKIQDGSFMVANGNFTPGIYMYSFRSRGENVDSGTILLR
ncbi:MAG: hypothetical protein SH857_16690 [Chitinophagales bacterium]|nr:hypothetical protein [Chitinophagales bacterium]